jgi:hypothetical protein
MDSIYFRDPLGQLFELASYRFEPPPGRSHAEELLEAHRIRVRRKDYNIGEEHLADAIEDLVRRDRDSLSKERSAKDPYARGLQKKSGSADSKKRRLADKAAPARKPRKARAT